ncbi:MAG: VWA domain-containing protein [Gammaproteobacteria bacterium]|jgi:hypothetical protein|nr:VWA domain-containing protein [Gammaproteobacteria bacterium]MBT3860044.1 VWA domain-containing protein [Gammaproteobacteria bacterium]MBT3987006.1 VWA domain-containing protein [Gammaproteobacteria bacterium]MBT4255366.1 VWA domain-containing protein [Gammaproteobacteria bacterium]MBT4580729.1 VWA domain-containing protein [Gammaproteobacteria bacterium]
MVFLTPIFLFGLLAALIPIGIHLIRKEKPPKLMFSSIRFLKKTSRKLILFQHIQQWLLLALRSLLIALLVFAFARPLIDQSVASLLDADPQSVVVMLDISMSMRYGDSFDQAKESALDIVNGLSSGDEVALLGFSNSAEVVRELDTDLDGARNLINSFDQAGYGVTRYMPNLRLADQLLETSRYENRSIYLISDFQGIALGEAEDGWKLAPGVSFTGIDVGSEESSNLAITEVRSPLQVLEDAEEQQVLARVRSTGTIHLDQGELSLFIDDELIERQAIDLTDRSEQVISFSSTFDDQGSHIGEVRLSGDSFSVDNSYFFTVDVLPKIRVLLVNGEASDDWFDDEGHWFGLAVSSAAQSPFLLESIEPAELSAAALRESDVAVLLNVGDLNTSQAQAVNEYVESGGSLFLAPGDQVEPDVFNRQFGNISPALLQGLGSLANDDYLVIADFDRRHPILSPLSSDWSARFQGHWSLQLADESDVLMRFDNTEAALAERNVGDNGTGGKVILFASAMDLEWNNLPLQGLFLPFVHETLRHLVQADSGQRNFQIGDNFSLDPSGAALNVEAVDASGTAITFANDSFLITAEQPGLIDATVDGNQMSYAVNRIAEESNFARTAVSGLYDAIINPDTDPNQTSAVQTAQLIQELERPQRIWWWILCLVMLLLLMEAIIANRTYR